MPPKSFKFSKIIKVFFLLGVVVSLTIGVPVPLAFNSGLSYWIKFNPLICFAPHMSPSDFILHRGTVYPFPRTAENNYWATVGDSRLILFSYRPNGGMHDQLCVYDKENGSVHEFKLHWYSKVGEYIAYNQSSKATQFVEVEMNTDSPDVLKLHLHERDSLYERDSGKILETISINLSTKTILTKYSKSPRVFTGKEVDY